MEIPPPTLSSVVPPYQFRFAESLIVLAPLAKTTLVAVSAAEAVTPPSIAFTCATVKSFGTPAAPVLLPLMVSVGIFAILALVTTPLAIVVALLFTAAVTWPVSAARCICPPPLNTSEAPRLISSTSPLPAVSRPSSLSVAMF